MFDEENYGPVSDKETLEMKCRENIPGCTLAQRVTKAGSTCREAHLQDVSFGGHQTPFKTSQICIHAPSNSQQGTCLLAY